MVTDKTTMIDRVEEYLVVRRAFGFALDIVGEQLRRFGEFADEVDPGGPMTLDLALRWAQQSRGERPIGPARRIEVLRPFARFLRTLDPRAEIPPRGILGAAHRRIAPRIFSDVELRDLLESTHSLAPVDGLRPHTIRCFLGLLACTGMRPTEPLRIEDGDLDLDEHTITIRQTKFAKSRVIVVDPSTSRALSHYARLRDEHVRNPESPSFFLIDGGLPLTDRKARTSFRRLCHELGWRSSRDGRQAPRLYDLRHTFVCRRLLAWYRDGVDVHTAIRSLSTYLGHVKITDTYWYVTGIPELLEVAGSRFESFSVDTGGNS